MRTKRAGAVAKRLVRTMAIGLFALVAACGGDQRSDTMPQGSKLLSSVVIAGATATFGGPRSNYTVIRTATGYVVIETGVIDPTVVPTTVQRLVFSDVSVNLTIADNVSALPFATQKLLVELYVAFFNRVPDADGLSYWVDQLKSGRSIESLAANFYDAAVQYSALTGYSSTMSNSDFVKIIYKNVLGRSGALAPPDADVNYWAGELANGNKTRGSLIKFMLGSAHSFSGDATWGWVPQLLDNKFAVAYYFSAQQGLNYNSPSESITKTMAITAAVTQTDMSAAVKLAGLNSSGVLPFAMQSGGAICGVGGCNGNFDGDYSGGGDGGGGDGGGGSGGGGGLSQMRNVIVTAYKPNGTILDKAELQNGLVSIYRHSYRGPFILEFAGKSNGEYYDEAKQAWVSFAGQKLRLMVPELSVGNHLSANALTEAAYQYAIKQNGSDAALDATKMLTANKLVLDQFNSKLPSKYQIADITLLPTLLNDKRAANALDNTEAGVFGSVLASTALAADNFSGKTLTRPALSFATQLAQDISNNGAITGTSATGTQAYGTSIANDLTTASTQAASTFGTTALQARAGTTLASFVGSYSGTTQYYDSVSGQYANDTWVATIDTNGNIVVDPSGAGTVAANGTFTGTVFEGLTGYFTGKIVLQGSSASVSGTFSSSSPGSYSITGTFTGSRN